MRRSYMIYCSYESIPEALRVGLETKTELRPEVQTTVMKTTIQATEAPIEVVTPVAVVTPSSGVSGAPVVDTDPPSSNRLLTTILGSAFAFVFVVGMGSVVIFYCVRGHRRRIRNRDAHTRLEEFSSSMEEQESNTVINF